MNSDAYYMQMALDAAAQARGRTRPNPLVGAVIVREGQVASVGYHRKAGQPHAEIEALRALEGSSKGCTMYVNLEPCSHTGRTGPCTQALIQAEFARVVIGVQDPDPRVNGRGIQQLREAGIQVTTGVLEEQSRTLNAAFFTYIQKRRPMVSMKVAMSLDASIATRTGDARWLSDAPARRWGHQMRDIVDGILVGANTVIADDPSLTVRMLEGRDPIRLVLDSSLRTPLTSKLYQPDLAEGTRIFTTTEDPEKIHAFEQQGVSVYTVPQDAYGHVDIHAVLQCLHQQGLLHILIEGGGEIHGAFLRERCVDQLFTVLTPWLLGEGSRPAFRLPGTDALADALKLEIVRSTPLGPDILIESIPKWLSS